MPPDQSANHVQLVGREALAAGEHQRLKPKLAGFVLAFYVDVRRFGTVEAREKEPIRSRDTPDSRHTRPSLPADVSVYLTHAASR